MMLRALGAFACLVISTAAACGSSDATSGPPVDAGSDASVIDAGADVSAEDARAVDASPDADAATPRRVLAISASPRLQPAPTPADFLDAVLLADGAGARGSFISKTWRAIEPSAGNFDFGSIANDVDFLGAQRGHDLLLGVQVLNTTAKETPPDLANVAFDDATMAARFHALIDALAPKLGPHLKWLSIGNEVDVYLAAHSAEWATYKVFFDDAAAYARKKLPGVRVGVTFTFGGAAGASNAEVARLNATSDALVLTYYPLGAAFEPNDPATATQDIAQMAALGAGKPVVLQEVGYPSSPVLSSSEAKQAAFFGNVMTAWQKEGAARIPFLNVFLLHDLTSQLCDQLAQYYGAPNDASFKAYLCSLGLRQSDGTAKAAWPALVTAAAASGLP